MGHCCHGSAADNAEAVCRGALVCLLLCSMFSSSTDQLAIASGMLQPALLHKQLDQGLEGRDAQAGVAGRLRAE